MVCLLCEKYLRGLVESGMPPLGTQELATEPPNTTTTGGARRQTRWLGRTQLVRLGERKDGSRALVCRAYLPRESSKEVRQTCKYYPVSYIRTYRTDFKLLKGPVLHAPKCVLCLVPSGAAQNYCMRTILVPLPMLAPFGDSAASGNCTFAK